MATLLRLDPAPFASASRDSGLSGILANPDEARRITLRPHFVIGRGGACNLQLAHATVSAAHASIEWERDGWYLRDLSSRNGTYINGRRIAERVRQPLLAGMNLRFGEDPTEVRILDVAAPLVRCVPEHGGPAIVLDDGLLLLPHPAAPRAVIVQRRLGDFCLEALPDPHLFPESGLPPRLGALPLIRVTTRDGSTTLGPRQVGVPVGDASIIEIDGLRWRLECPRSLDETAGVMRDDWAVPLQELDFHFAVSPDEERVVVSIGHKHSRLTFAERSCHYLLLTLARARLGLQPRIQSNAGWVACDELEHLLRIGQQQLNLNIFRLRSMFSDLGVVDADQLIERRSRPREIRIGSSRLQIERSPEV